MSSSAVLDANVLVPIALCDLLIRASEAGLYRVFLTDAILAEVERTLVNDLHLSPSASRRRITAVRTAEIVTLVTGYESRIAAMPNDPGDRHVLAAALHVGAGVIVTQNLRHFSVPALAPYSAVAQSADDFLLTLLATDRATLLATLRTQAADMTRPPQTLPQLLVRLEAETPRFVRRAFAALRDAEQ